MPAQAPQAGCSPVCRVLGFEDATGENKVFPQLVLARIIEPASKLGSLRVLEATGVAATSYRTCVCRHSISARVGVGAAAGPSY